MVCLLVFVFFPENSLFFKDSLGNPSNISCHVFTKSILGAV